MKPRKSVLFFALLALLLAAFAVGMGQSTTQTDQKKKAESCCAEGSSCCAEGSCKEGESKESCCKDGAECCKEGAECCKEHANKDHADCCSGESCDMAKHDGNMKHDGKMKHDPKKAGECCKMKDKDKTKTKKAA